MLEKNIAAVTDVIIGEESNKPDTKLKLPGDNDVYETALVSLPEKGETAKETLDKKLVTFVEITSIGVSLSVFVLAPLVGYFAPSVNA